MPLLLVLPKLLGETGGDLREDRGDARAEDAQDANHNNGNQHKNKGVLDQTLAVLTREDGANHGPHFFS